MSSEEKDLAGGGDSLVNPKSITSEPSNKQTGPEETKKDNSPLESEDKIVDTKVSDDVEVILDSTDDDEDIQLKWDDDEEIEEDIISLDRNPSPLKEEENTATLTKTDKVSVDEVVENVDSLLSPSPEESLETIQKDIDKICSEMQDDIDEIDNDQSKLDESKSRKSTSPNDDLILIEDDKIEDNHTKKSERVIVKAEISNDISENLIVKENKHQIVAVDETTCKKKIELTEDDKSIDADKNHEVAEQSKATDSISKESEEIGMEVDNEKDRESKISSPNQSLSETISIEANQEHGLNKPDIMLEIPTQEVIEFLDDTDVSCDLNKSNSTTEDINIENEVADNVTNKKNTESTDVKLHTKQELTKESKEVNKTSETTESIKEKPEITESNDDIKISETSDLKKTQKIKEKVNDVISMILQENEEINTDSELIIEKTVPELVIPAEITANKEPKNTTEADGIEATTNKDTNDDEISTSKELIKPIEPQPSTSTIVSTKVVTPAVAPVTNEDLTSKELPTIEPKPSAAQTNVDEVAATNDKLTDSLEPLAEPHPSTSNIVVGTEDNVPVTKVELSEVTDSLGLLAESSRVMEDDEEPEDEEEEDEDFDQDQDESSNQMTAEHSEDSNAQQSETDGAKDSPHEDKEEFNFAIGGVVTVAKEKEDKDMKDIDVDMLEKDGDMQEKDLDMLEKDGDLVEKDGDIDVDEILDEVEVSPEQIGDELAVEPTTEVTVGNLVPEEAVKDKPSEVKPASDIETVKLSDTSDNEVESESLLRSILQKSTEAAKEKSQSPVKKLEITEISRTSYNYVDLEESSSEDDVQEVNKKDSTKPASVEVSSIDLKEVATIAAEIPKTSTKTKTPRINTSEISIRTISSAEAAALPQINPPEEKVAPKIGLEVFSLDSDEEDSSKPADVTTQKDPPEKPVETFLLKGISRCLNLFCKSNGRCGYVKADASVLSYYEASGKKRSMVCEECAFVVQKRTQNLVEGIKSYAPLLELDIIKDTSELVEISDSESEDEAENTDEVTHTIGKEGVKLLEEHLADLLNHTWKKYKLDERLTEAQDMLNEELKTLAEESKEVGSMLDECQIATDKLRKDLYATFEHERQELQPLIIYDTPSRKTIGAKRRLSSSNETPAKRVHSEPIPLGYSPLDNKDAPKENTQDHPTASDSSKLDDDKDISVLQVSAEAAPSELPPPGELTRPQLRVGSYVYGMRNIFGSWVRCRILEVQGKASLPGSTHLFTLCKVKFESKARNPVKVLPARCLAYSEPTSVRMTIGTRVIALFKDTNDKKRDSFYSGIISEVPNPVNKYRYLIFFDDGYAQYVRHADTRLVCECASLVWEEVHPFSREFVKEYLMAYPERPMVRLHAGQSLKTEWNGKWWSSRVTKVDASLVQVYFEEDNRTEWIYRGSTRLAPLYLELQAAERHRARPMPRTKAQPRINMPYVEYTRQDEQNKSDEASPPQPAVERETRQRAVAKKSTTPAPAPTPLPQPPPAAPDGVTSRVVYYTPKNAVRPYKMVAHTCGPQCKRSDVLALKDLRTYNPLAKPLLSGWERQIVRYKCHKEVMYRAPCGRRLRNMRELHYYLQATQSDMAVDLFDFAPATHCLAEFVLNTCLVGKKDLSHGKENVPVPCVNYYDESLPEFCSYNTERTPTAGVPLNLDPEFLCGCDCTDDCEDKSKCACWQMTLEGARTIGIDGPEIGYVYRRLPEPLPTGIYECNSRCKCKQTCLNRVAQHPLQLKLQVFKTLNRGWGIRALNDVPKGAFLCVYAGNLLTDATANMDGLNEGDEYLAELDYIEVVEQMKEGFEEDIPEADKRLDKKNQAKASDEDSEEMSSSEEEDNTRDDQQDDDFRPAFDVPLRVTEFSKRLRKRDKKKQKADAKDKDKDRETQQKKPEDDCITISDDEEVREPSHFMAQAGMVSNEFKSKYKSVRSHFGKDEACYIMDAKVQGNIGRYLNHSCTPNVFVQNVFVDTHDPRFPWVAFFALCHIKAGTELTWNYNYDVGSVPGKILYCYCGAPNCRGRLL